MLYSSSLIEYAMMTRNTNRKQIHGRYNLKVLRITSKIFVDYHTCHCLKQPEGEGWMHLCSEYDAVEDTQVPRGHSSQTVEVEAVADDVNSCIK